MRRLAMLVLLVGCNDSGITVHNASPEANVVSPDDGAQVSEGTIVHFVGTGSDPDKGDTLTAAWLSGADVLCEPTELLDDGTTTCDTSLPAGEVTVTLVVQDASNASDEDDLTLSVVANAQPVATISLPEADATFFADDLVAFEATVSDAEDHPDELTIWWESSLDGTLGVDTDPDEDGRIAGSGYLSAGQHALTLHAVDTADNEGTDTVLVTIKPPNSAPTCALTAPPDNSLGEAGEDVTFEGLVGDVDISADELTVTWSSDQQGLLATSVADSDGNVSFSTTTLSEATHVITLTASDDQGATCTDDVLYTVGTPPVITLSAPSTGDVINEGDDVSFVAQVTDGDNSPGELDVSWTSDVDGTFSSQGPDSSGHIAFATNSLSVATHTVTALATDPDGLYSRAVVTFQVNGLPSAPVVSLSPDPPTTSDELVVSIDTDSVDPEGAAVAYAYAWTENGVPRASYTTDTLPASATSKNDVWKVVVTPSDAYGAGATASDQVTIANTPPTTPTVSIDPDDPLEGADDFQCVVDVDSTDADGDSVAYSVKWKVDGVSFTGATTTDETGDTILALDTTAEEAWTCTVTPTDGTDAGTAGTATVYVLGVPVDYAHIQYPCSASIARTTGTLDVYAWIYQPGVTDDYGEGPAITAEVGVGADGSDPETATSWTWTAATYNDDKPAYGDSTADPPPYNNDEYLGTIAAPSTTGSFDYAFRVSTDSGLSWTWVDLGGLTCGGDGTIDGYDPADAGDLTVYP